MDAPHDETAYGLGTKLRRLDPNSGSEQANVDLLLVGVDGAGHPLV